MVTIVNPSSATRIFGGTSVTYTYNNSGADLIVALGLTSTFGVPNFSSVTYNGVAMTQILNNNRGSLGYREASYYLAGAAQGNNTLQWNLSSISGNIGQIIIAGVDNCNGPPFNTRSNGLRTTPHVRNITVATNAVVFAYTSSYFPVNEIRIDGVTQTILGNANSNRYMAGAFSQSLPAGAREVRMINTFSLLTNVRIELGPGAPPPTITLSTASLSGFTYVEGSGPSASQTFIVSGDDLTADATVTATTNYEISTDDVTYSSPIVLGRTGTDLTGEPVTIYVRLKSGLTEGAYNNEDITVTSTGATTQTVTCSGDVTAAGRTRRIVLVG